MLGFASLDTNLQELDSFMVGRIALDIFQFDPDEPNIPRLLREQTGHSNPDIPYFTYAFETDFDTLLGLLKGLLDIDEPIWRIKKVSPRPFELARSQTLILNSVLARPHQSQNCQLG